MTNYVTMMGSNHVKFAAFILSHGRAEKISTWRALRATNYSGEIYVICDNEDRTIEDYRRAFGPERVLIFDKARIAETFDAADTQENRQTIAYARNASFEIARKLDLDYFLQLDDDYQSFRYRWIEEGIIRSRPIKSMDSLIEAVLTFLDESNAASIAFSQGGDHIGGIGGQIRKKLKRKAMNTFFCRTDKPIEFLGRINEDVNTYVTYGGRGELFLTLLNVQFEQHRTQQQAGGMTEIYRDGGTYVKSFYTVMMNPSCVKVSSMGPVARRYHHQVNWDLAVPKILSGKYKNGER